MDPVELCKQCPIESACTYMVDGLDVEQCELWNKLHDELEV